MKLFLELLYYFAFIFKSTKSILPIIAVPIIVVKCSSFCSEYFFVRSLRLVMGVSTMSSKHSLTNFNNLNSSSGNGLHGGDGVGGLPVLGSC